MIDRPATETDVGTVIETRMVGLVGQLSSGVIVRGAIVCQVGQLSGEVIVRGWMLDVGTVGMSRACEICERERELLPGRESETDNERE